MKTNKKSKEQNLSDRQPDEQKTINEMNTIRTEHHEPRHNRLADFEKQQKEDFQPGLKVGFGIAKEGQVDIKEIQDQQDLIETLVGMFGNHPQLYGFEVYEDEHSESPKEEQDKQSHSSPDLER